MFSFHVLRGIKSRVVREIGQESQSVADRSTSAFSFLSFGVDGRGLGLGDALLCRQP